MKAFFKQLGPGLLFAGAAIGVSHLVQSTRAGADYGFGLVWALVLIHVIKYPFFQFGPRYAAATGQSLLDGYKRLGKAVLILYFCINLLTIFTIQTAVTIVTVGQRGGSACNQGESGKFFPHGRQDYAAYPCRHPSR